MSSQQQKQQIIAVVGPTASGKSALGIALALQLNGEIINCDSVQVYQGIEIATAKVPLAERQGVPHHLIDFVPPEVNYTAGEWARAAAGKQLPRSKRAAGCLCWSAGRGSICARCAVRSFPVRQPIPHCGVVSTEFAKRHGAEHLHRILKRLDHAAAAQLYPRDWPRVQRAIEVYLQTGRAISAQKDLRPEPPESARRLRILAL